MGTKSGPGATPASRQLGTNKGAAVTPLLAAGHPCRTNAAWAGGCYLRLSDGDLNPAPCFACHRTSHGSGKAAFLSLPVHSVCQKSTMELKQPHLAQREVGDYSGVTAGRTKPEHPAEFSSYIDTIILPLLPETKGPAQVSLPACRAHCHTALLLLSRVPEVASISVALTNGTRLPLVSFGSFPPSPAALLNSSIPSSLLDLPAERNSTS